MTGPDILASASITFGAAAVLAFALTPAVRRLAHHVQAVDHPGERRVNTTPVPRGGGVAVGVAFLLVVAALFATDAIVGLWGPLDALTRPEVAALFLGGAAAVVVGLLDDQLDLRARWQFGGQLLVALVPVGLGITVGAIANPFGPGVISLEGVWGAIFVVVWTLGMMNSINFIDGLDGLSSGVAIIAAVTLGIISATGLATEPVLAVVCIILAGALLGFLRWNFHPASIFIGTSGVMFLGYTLALLSIMGSAKVVVALLVLGVPIIDTFYIIVRRLSRGRSPFSPDRGHIHHRLLDLGLSHTQTVLLIYAICIGLGILSLVLSGTGQLYAFLGVFVGFGLVILILDRVAENRASDDGAPR
ncbi:MAG TPA: MraY family glycosyltransferase [Patescibacteria group bacterium]|nr:MraY family glycosyltransferase [Patescibacteria group bacterium]